MILWIVCQNVLDYFCSKFIIAFFSGWICRYESFFYVLFSSWIVVVCLINFRVCVVFFSFNNKIVMAKAFIFELTKVDAYYMTFKFKMFDSIQQQTKKFNEVHKKRILLLFQWPLFNTWNVWMIRNRILKSSALDNIFDQQEKKRAAFFERCFFGV